MARPSDRSELRFLISQRVPSTVSPRGRTETLASTRIEPSSILASLTPVASRIERSSLTYVSRLLGGVDVGPAHDLDERHAGAVVVDQRIPGLVDAPAAADVRVLARVLFDVRPFDADAAAVAQLERTRRR